MELEERGEGRCAAHPERAASGTCVRCGKVVCAECRSASPRGGCSICERRTPARLVWWHGVLLLVAVGVAAQLAGGVALLAALFVHALITGVPLASIASGETLTFATMAPSIAATGLVMAGGALVAPRLAGVPLREALGLRAAPWPAFVAAPIGILALGPTSDVLRRLMQTYAPGLTFGSLEQLDQIARGTPVWLSAPFFALLPGIAEELLFRGAFQRSIRTGWLAVVLSGVLFAVYHVDPHHVAAVLPLGLYLAWLGHRTDSVLVPITAHVANNATAVIAVAFAGSERDEGGLEALGPDAWWIPAGLAIASAAIAVVWWCTRRAAEPRADRRAEPVREAAGAVEDAEPR